MTSENKKTLEPYLGHSTRHDTVIKTIRVNIIPESFLLRGRGTGDGGWSGISKPGDFGSKV